MNIKKVMAPIMFLIITVMTVLVMIENYDMYHQMKKHAEEYHALQNTLKEQRKNWAENSALDKTNRSGLSRIASQALMLTSLPDFIKDLDQRMAVHSLFREDVSYVKKESVGSFGLVRVQLQLSGPYEEFRKFLSDLEKHPNFLWVKSVQAAQAKTFLKFVLVLHVLVKTG